MKNKQTDFWYYSRKERRATLSLLVITLLTFLFPTLYRFFNSSIPNELPEAYRQEIAQLDSLLQQQPTEPIVAAELFHFDPNTVDRQTLIRLGLPPATAQTILRYREKVEPFRRADDLTRIYNLTEADYERLRPYVRIVRSTAQEEEPSSEPVTAIQLTNFDPNTADLDQLRMLGFPQKVARTLVNFRDKGGRFWKPQDLSRIYGMSPDLYHRLEPYIHIDSTPFNYPSDTDSIRIQKATRGTTVAVKSPPSKVVDINRATAEEWASLPGIGPVRSQRIIKFRDKLGGFATIDQVAETFGLPDSTFQKIRPQLRYSPHTPGIAINTWPADSLQAHPYIRWQQANVIVAYRQEHGPYRNLDDLRRVRALDKDFIERIAPYLAFE